MDLWIGQMGLLREKVVPAASSRGFCDHPTARVAIWKSYELIPQGMYKDNQQFGDILFRRSARTLSQDLDRHFKRLPLLVQRGYLQFDLCDHSD